MCGLFLPGRPPMFSGALATPPSATRLSGLRPDPWLCVPASRRVCLYREGIFPAPSVVQGGCQYKNHLNPIRSLRLARGVSQIWKSRCQTAPDLEGASCAARKTEVLTGPQATRRVAAMFTRDCPEVPMRCTICAKIFNTRGTHEHPI